jgi:hypothetical protein
MALSLNLAVFFDGGCPGELKPCTVGAKPAILGGYAQISIGGVAYIYELCAICK